MLPSQLIIATLEYQIGMISSFMMTLTLVSGAVTRFECLCFCVISLVNQDDGRYPANNESCFAGFANGFSTPLDLT